MDLRKQKSSSRNFRPPDKFTYEAASSSGYQYQSSNQSPLRSQQQSRHDYSYQPRDGSRGAPDQRSYGNVGDGDRSYGRTRLTSPPQQPVRDDSQTRIESRHEELKRQIAMKEKQLAEMTSERNTTERLRGKLGLHKNASQQRSFPSIMGEERGRTGPESKRSHLQHSSHSPHTSSNYHEAPGMVGMRSSHFRPTGQSTSQGRHDNRPSPEHQEQLQFHPTRLSRPTGAQNSNSIPTHYLERGQHNSGSPLRSKSRSGGGGDYSFTGQPRDQPRDKTHSRERDADVTYNHSQHSNEAAYPRGSSVNRTSGLPPRMERPMPSTSLPSGGILRTSQSPLRQSSPPRSTFGREETDAHEGSLIKPQVVRMEGTHQNSTRDLTQGLQRPYGASKNSLGGGYREGSVLGESITNSAVEFKRFSGPNAREQLYKDRIEAMSIDNSSLQRRLGQVTAELERIVKEKEELQRSFRQRENENTRVDRTIHEKDEIDMENQAMKEELERHRLDNERLTKRLKDEEMENQNAECKLTNVSAARKNLEFEKDGFLQDLDKRLNHITDLNRNTQATVGEMGQVSHQLERLKQDELHLNHENIDLDKHMQKLMLERQELLRNLENLTQSYDECVRDLTKDRREMEAQNDWNTKIMVAKLVFENITKFQRTRKQSSFHEMAEYCKFDKDCHQKLKIFANKLQKLGLYKQKIGLHQWYDKALKPIQTRWQNEDVSILIDCNTLQARVFYAWKQYQQDKMDRYHFKTNAIDKIWFLLNRGCRQELKRALSIWKGRKSFDIEKLKRAKNLAIRRRNNLWKAAFHQWQTYSLSVEHASRVRVLQIDLSQKLFLSQVFSQMKFTLTNERRIRIRSLNQCVKAWKDYIRYNRHLMQVNMAAIRFGKTNQRLVVKNIFDELKRNKEQKRYDLINMAVEEDVNIAIVEAKQFNDNKQGALLTANQRRAGNIVIAMMGKQLYSYFNHWKLNQGDYSMKLKSIVKGRVLRLYVRMMDSYFTKWADNLNVKRKQVKSRAVIEMQLANESLQNDALQGERQLRQATESLKSNKRCMVDKTFRKLFYRKLRAAVERWKDLVFCFQTQEDKMLIQLIKYRRRMLSQAMTRYKAFLRRSQQHDRNVRSAAYYQETLITRNLREKFNAMCQYTNRQKRAKQYWTKILHRMDLFLKLRATKTWLDNANLSHEGRLQGDIASLMDHLQEQKEEMSALEKMKTTQTNAICTSDLDRTNQAYKQIGAYFFKAYSLTTANAFRVWKFRSQINEHKKKLMLRYIQHWENFSREQAVHILRKWLCDQRSDDSRQAIKQSQFDQQALQTTIEFEKQEALKRRQEATQEIQAYGGSSYKLNDEYTKLMMILERRSKEWQVISRKRMIFLCWRRATKQQKAFCICIKNALEKSMYKKGIACMIESVNTEQRESRQAHLMRRAIRRAFRINATECFNRWKKASLTMVEQSRDQANAALMTKSEDFEAFVQRAKDRNTARCFAHFMDINKRNLWRAWLNVINHLKLVKNQTAEFKRRQVRIQRLDALHLWQARVRRTKFCRARETQLVQQFQFKYYRSAFYALKRHYKRTSHLAKALSNFENAMRTKISMDAFKDVKSFAVSKGLVIQQTRKKGAEDIANLIFQRYIRTMRAEFQRYKNKSGVHGEKCTKLKTAFGKASTFRLRDAFDFWKRKHTLAELNQELYDTGPVRAEHWEAEREIANLKEFMRKEQYREFEIDMTFNKVCKENDDRMKKYISRIRIQQQGDHRLLPIVWNRWKEYVGIRKLIKYQFRFCHNKSQNTKADLQYAFNKWRRGPSALEKELSKLPYDTLQKLAYKTTLQVEDCGDTIAENQSIQNHLLIQRDEFLNYYVKSQILAMALMKDRNVFAEFQAQSRWGDRVRLCNKTDLQKSISEAEFLYANLQDKEKEFKESNKNLSAENKELTQFSEDGQVIRRNMERLKEERDKLHTQLTDTDDDYKELMEENERLKREIEITEEKLKTHVNPRFQNLKTLKAPQIAEDEEEEEPEETEEQRKLRERFSRLEKLNQGASLR